MKNVYTADFETTTTEPAKVWAFGLCEVGNSENFIHGTKISEMIKYCKNKGNCKLYFHNLKFDGSYILDWLFKNNFTWKQDKKECIKNDFVTIIDEFGKFYAIEIYFSKTDKKSEKITIYDSMKLLNMSVEKVAKSFNLHLKKGIIDYKRHDKGCKITQEEIEYLKNDVAIMSQALEQMFKIGFNKMTIGACALNDYKKTIDKKQWEIRFPELALEIDSAIRASYRGGYTFVNPDNQNIDIGRGVVFDVNSLYPWVMHDCELPYGKPLYYTGQYIKNEEYPLFICNIRCFFKLKKGYLPTIQLKHNASFIATEYLKSSVNEYTGIDELTDLCLTSVDFELFMKHYDVYCLEYIDGYMFKSSNKIFSEWVDKWIKKKIESELDNNIGMRTICKLILNNLYGKFSVNPFIASKFPYFDEEEEKVKYSDILYPVLDENGEQLYYSNGVPQTTNKTIRKSLYIPIGTFITAWARHATITASQIIHSESIEKTGKSRYLYSDTDSIHLSGFEIPKCIAVHSTKLGYWKHESSFKRARFLQAKRYIEDEIKTDKDGKLLKDENGEYITKLKITCAGMPSRCYNNVTWKNFKFGSKFKGKLVPKTVKGGIILVETEFTMNEKRKIKA